MKAVMELDGLAEREWRKQEARIVETTLHGPFVTAVGALMLAAQSYVV